MHYYTHNIKTFDQATRHLTRVERSLYRDLIELYYDAESPLQAGDFDRLARKVIANSEDEKAALRYVLDEFFVLSGDVYHHEYCDEKIAEYRENSSKKSKAGKASAAARSKKKEQESSGVEQSLNKCATNHKPLTTNHKPVTNSNNNGDKSPSTITQKMLVNDYKIPDGVARDFLTVRKAKRAPLTPTAWNRMCSEFGKAGLSIPDGVSLCVANGWAGFKSTWEINAPASTGPTLKEYKP